MKIRLLQACHCAVVYWSAEDRKKIDKLASEIGLDMKRFKDDIKSKRYRGQVVRDIALATRLKVPGTPTFYVNGRRLVRNNLAEFKKVIEFELK